MPVFGTGGQVLRQRPADRRRALLSQQLLSQGADTSPAGHPLEAVGRIAQSLSGAFIGKQLENQTAEREKAAQEALADALTSGTQVADTGGLGPGGAGGGLGSTSQEALIRRLSENPDLAPFAMQLQLDQFQSQQNLQNQLRLARQKRDIEGPKGLISPEAEAQRIRLRQAGQVLSPEALEQKKGIAGAGRAQNIGTIPPGFQVVQDGNTISMVPIPGSPAAQEIEAGEEQTEARVAQERRQANIVTEDIGRAEKILDTARLPTTGSAGELLSNIGGTAARDLRGLVDTIKANVGFDKLQAMRNASPTGGALGQVSERENLLLQATLGNLEQSQSEGQFRFNLNRLNDIYLDIIHGPGEGPERRGGPPATSDGLSDDDLLKGLGIQ